MCLKDKCIVLIPCGKTNLLMRTTFSHAVEILRGNTAFKPCGIVAKNLNNRELSFAEVVEQANKVDRISTIHPAHPTLH